MSDAESGLVTGTRLVKVSQEASARVMSQMNYSKDKDQALDENMDIVATNGSTLTDTNICYREC